jgi:glucarate dehydratase
VELDRDKLHKYAELFRREGGYAYDRDPKRPEWFAIVPETRFAQPTGVRQKRTARRRTRK